MKYGAMNSPLRSLNSEIELIAELGFDYLELTMDAPFADAHTLKKQKKQVRELLSGLGLELVCHLPTFVSVADLTGSIRDASVRETVDSLAMAKELGCLKVVLHPWFLSGLGVMLPEIAAGFGRSSLEMILAQGEKLGVKVCLENLFPRSKSLVKPDDFVSWLDGHDTLGLTLDTGHAHLAGGTRMIVDFIDRFADRIAHVHVSDNRGRADDHLPIGAGTIDFVMVINALKKARYDDSVTFEVFTDDRRYLVLCREKFAEMLRAAA